MPDQKSRTRTRKNEATTSRKLPSGKGGFDGGQSKGAADSAQSDTRGNILGGEPSSGGIKLWKPLVALAAAAAIGISFLTGTGGGPSVDVVSDSDSQSRQAAYEQLLMTPGLELRQVAAEDIDRAITDMPSGVSIEQREELRNDITQGRVKLAWLTVWDTHAQDGDILRFESNASFPIEVSALNAKTTIAIPYPADGQVLVTGVHDGGGGITIALESGAASIAWPTMAPGDTLLLPVTTAL